MELPTAGTKISPVKHVLLQRGGKFLGNSEFSGLETKSKTPHSDSDSANN